MSDELENAKKIILAHLDKVCTVKNTKWVLDETGEQYIEVDAGYSEKEMEITRMYHYRDMKGYYKLRDLLEDLL